MSPQSYRFQKRKKLKNLFYQWFLHCVGGGKGLKWRPWTKVECEMRAISTPFPSLDQVWLRSKIGNWNRSMYQSAIAINFFLKDLKMLSSFLNPLNPLDPLFAYFYSISNYQQFSWFFFFRLTVKTQKSRFTLGMLYKNQNIYYANKTKYIHCFYKSTFPNFMQTTLNKYQRNIWNGPVTFSLKHGGYMQVGRSFYTPYSPYSPYFSYSPYSPYSFYTTYSPNTKIYV